MNTILHLVERLSDLESQVEQAEEALKALKQQREELSTKSIPDAMTEAGLVALELADGRKVEVQPVVSGRLGPGAVEWLMENNHEGLLKRKIVLAYDPERFAQLQQTDPDASIESDIHHQTLNAFLREQIKAGTPLPAKAFGLYQGFKTNIKQKNK